jgi:dTDP-4-dehydrorhamnose reductase
MRLLVTGASGLIGSNLTAAAAQQSWSVLGTWRETPVSVFGARTAALDVTDRRACAALAEELEPDVIVHAAAESSPGRLEREPRLSELNLLGTEHTLAAARTVRAHYVLVSCDLVFSGLRPSGECWEEDDPTEPVGALGRSLLACERLVERYAGSWLITRPADVYGINLSIPGTERLPAREDPPGHRNGTAGPAEPGFSSARHVWERSGMPLRWMARLRAGRPLVAPAGIRRSPTYAWDYAHRVCDLIAQECEGRFHTAGPTILGRLAHLRLLARAFDCDMELVREGPPAAFLRACGEEIGLPPAPPIPLPANTALCDRKASFVLGRPAVDPFTGHRLMRRQLEHVLRTGVHPPPPLAPPLAPAPPVTIQALG